MRTMLATTHSRLTTHNLLTGTSTPANLFIFTDFPYFHPSSLSLVLNPLPMSRAIPLVDLKKFTDGNEAEKKKFVDELGHAFQEFGFVGVINHGIPKELVAKFYAEAKAFFSLPVDVKE